MFEHWDIGETAEELNSDLHRGLKMEEAAKRKGTELTSCNVAELNELWREAKKEEN